jgi:hypothetical protein
MAIGEAGCTILALLGRVPKQHEQLTHEGELLMAKS